MRFGDVQAQYCVVSRQAGVSTSGFGGFSGKPMRSKTPRIVSARRADGSLVCLSDLPPNKTRWTRLRKLAVVECHDFGLIDTEEACRRYELTPSELAEWKASTATRSSREMIWTDRPRNQVTGVVRAGALAIDLGCRTVKLDDRLIETSPSEWTILKALAEADGAVVSTSMILGALYRRQEDAAGPKTADVLICRLRRKLGTEADRVSAVWGRGYRLLK